MMLQEKKPMWVISPSMEFPPLQVCRGSIYNSPTPRGEQHTDESIIEELNENDEWFSECDSEDDLTDSDHHLALVTKLKK